jgi:hypothetical protein
MKLTRKDAGREIQFLNVITRIPDTTAEPNTDETDPCYVWVSAFNPVYAEATHERVIDDTVKLLVKAFYDGTVFGEPDPYPDVSGLPIEMRQKLYEDTHKTWEVFKLKEDEFAEFDAELKKELLLD